MKPVFADTAFLLALINPRDQYHGQAVGLNATLNAPLLTTAWVLVEFANAIAGSRGRKNFADVLERLRSEPEAEILPPDNDPFDRGSELYVSRADQTWSLTDCISFVVITDRGLTDALTTDRHFEQAALEPFCWSLITDFVRHGDHLPVPGGIDLNPRELVDA